MPPLPVGFDVVVYLNVLLQEPPPPLFLAGSQLVTGEGVRTVQYVSWSYRSCRLVAEAAGHHGAGGGLGGDPEQFRVPSSNENIILVNIS